MNRLPSELINKIVSFVSDASSNTRYAPDMKKRADVQQELEARVKIAPLATISSEWRSIVEAHLFRSLLIGTEDWDTFVEYLAPRERRKNLKGVSLWISGPAMSEDLVFGSRFEECVLEHLQEYWQRLADSIRELYTRLDGWGKDLEVRTLSVHLPVHPVIDNAHYGDEASLRCGVPYKDLSDYFPQGYTLPIWPKMKHLSYSGKEHRISTAFFQKLAKASPNLISWSVEADEMERRRPKIVLESRKALYEGSGAIPTSLREVELNLEFFTRLNQLTTPNNYMSDGMDVFSAWVRNVSLNLTKLDLQASQLSAELFWPQADQDAKKPPHWPHLLEFNVTTSIECAKGQYMLLEADKDHPYEEMWVEPEDSDVDDTDSDYQLGNSRQHYTRIRPCHALFDELSAAMAQAMNQMPKLRKLLYRTDSLSRGMNNPGSSEFAFSCYHDSDGNDARTRIDWIFACSKAQLLGWQMPDEVLKMLNQRWGSWLDIAYVTHEAIDGRGWIRRTSKGQEEQWMLMRFFEDGDHYVDWG